MKKLIAALFMIVGIGFLFLGVIGLFTYAPEPVPAIAVSFGIVVLVISVIILKKAR